MVLGRVCDRKRCCVIMYKCMGREVGGDKDKGWNGNEIGGQGVLVGWDENEKGMEWKMLGLRRG